MKDITSPFWIKTKGFLFLFLGFSASALLVFEKPTFKVVALLAVAIWSFCRFYYFAFYVIENYVDRKYRFAGLGAFFAYLWKKK